MGDLEVTLEAQNGARRTMHTDEDGAFRFEALRPGTYRVTIALPTDTVGTTDTGQDVVIPDDGDTPDMAFGLVVPPEDVLRAMHGLPAEDEATPDAEEASDDQVMALSAVTSLPLRFAEGRDLMAQVGRRVLGDGLVWLGCRSARRSTAAISST